ncbi:MAG TPA: GDCCVxC domain-containing (seleno)protein [Gemmatimonadales bacterium]|nr:GDCCVxC domain-containing (seleno)protein [Gemmatimonadales bacterium]
MTIGMTIGRAPRGTNGHYGLAKWPRSCPFAPRAFVGPRVGETLNPLDDRFNSDRDLPALRTPDDRNHANQCQRAFLGMLGCRTILPPKPGDCSTFCSYGSSRCPPRQTEGT